MEVTTGVMSQAMDNVYQTSIDQNEVSGLLQEVADQNALQMNADMVNQVGTGAIANPNVAVVPEEKSIDARLAALQNI